MKALDHSTKVGEKRKKLEPSDIINSKEYGSLEENSVPGLSAACNRFNEKKQKSMRWTDGQISVCSDGKPLR